MYNNIRTPKVVYMQVIAYDTDPTISGAIHGKSHACLCMKLVGCFFHTFFSENVYLINTFVCYQ